MRTARTGNVPKKIIVHHTGDVFEGAQYRKINEYHRSREFPRSSRRSYVGYHYLIERNGQEKRARYDNEEGAHTKGHNMDSIGIALAGDFNVQEPTDAQIKTLSRLLSEYRHTYRIPVHKIFPHRYFRKTDCYGARLDNGWAARLAIGEEISLIRQILLWVQLAISSIFSKRV